MKSKARGMGRWPLIGLTALVLLVAGGALLAPELLGYYRFSKAVQAQSETDEARGGEWPQLHKVCLLCHGDTGDSLNQRYPDLAGQPAAYLVQQLQAYANGERAHPNMSPLAATLSAEEIAQLAAYFAAQPAVANITFQPDPAQREKGKKLVEQGGCAACHGADFSGQGSFPRLAGQGFNYLVGQLRAYRSGTRRDPTGTMPAMTAALSDEDIEAMAQFLSSHHN